MQKVLLDKQGIFNTGVKYEDNIDEVVDFISNKSNVYICKMAVSKEENGRVNVITYCEIKQTNNQSTLLCKGDWAIKDQDGHVIFCPAALFDSLYVILKYSEEVNPADNKGQN